MKFKFRIEKIERVNGNISFEVYKKGWLFCWFLLDVDSDPLNVFCKTGTPFNTRDEALQLIDKEIKHHKDKIESKNAYKVVRTSIEIVEREL